MQEVHGGKRKLSTSMAKQWLLFGWVDKVTWCVRALTRLLTMSKVLESVFELDTSFDDGSEI